MAPLLLDDAQPIDGEVAFDEVIEGDLVFCARPSFLQELCTRAGEPWRHVGLALQWEGELSVIEVSGPRFGSRPLARFMEAYDRVAIGRVEPVARPRAELAAQWCARHVGAAQLYAWDDLMLAGFIAATRRFVLPDGEPRLERMVESAVDSLRASRSIEHLGGDLPGYSCSAFVLAGFAHAGHPIDFDLARPRAGHVRPSVWELIRGGSRPLRSAGGSRISSAQAAALLRALIHAMVAGAGPGPGREPDRSDWFRWATPGDIWRSPTLVERWLVGRP